MKKLLLLGGSHYLIPAIKKAKELGCYTIVCDYLPDNISHKFCDKHYNISIVDKDKVLSLAKELEIDGVMSFACDPGVVTAAYVADQMGLPAPGPYQSVCILQNKGLFRAFLRDNGFNVPRAVSFSAADYSFEEIEGIGYPFIVKPTDSAGSKGVSVVYQQSELLQAIRYALTFSRRKEFIIEEYIEAEGFSSDSDCFSVDGELLFTSFSKQRFDRSASNPFTPAAYSWPSSFSQSQENELKNELQRLIHLLGMRTSIYNVETRIGKNEKPYIMEVSPRAGGNRLSEMLYYSTGTDLISKSVCAALGIPFDNNFSQKCDKYWAEIILHADSDGIFQNLWVSDDVKKNVIETDLWVKQGEPVKAFSAANDAVGTMVLCFDTEKDLEKMMSNIGGNVGVNVK